MFTYRKMFHQNKYIVENIYNVMKKNVTNHYRKAYSST